VKHILITTDARDDAAAQNLLKMYMQKFKVDFHLLKQQLSSLKIQLLKRKVD
jgi:hypothetical protein